VRSWVSSIATSNCLKPLRRDAHIDFAHLVGGHDRARLAFDDLAPEIQNYQSGNDG